MMRKKFRIGSFRFLIALLFISLLLGVIPSAYASSLHDDEPPIDPTTLISDPPLELGPSDPIEVGPIQVPNPDPLAPALIYNFEGLNITNSGYIPPDPIAAAGPNHVVSVINVNIQWREKDGTNTTSQTLASFFTSLSPANATFDPKVIYDQFAGRFVVVTLESVSASPNANPSPSNTSRLLIAVSDTNDPTGTWSFQAINSKVSSGGYDYWADYPGFAVDEEAIYITANMFAFSPTPPSGSFLGARLWIIDKFNPTGGLYGGGTSNVSLNDPYASVGTATTTQPAHVFNSPTAMPAGVGTFLVSYSGLSAGGIEAVQVVRVDSPLTSPIFSQVYVSVGDIDNTATGMPDAPQLGSATAIETNDRRALHAVWRDNSLWLTTTVVPGSGADAGQATAHWVEIDTTNLSGLSVADQGRIGGEDIATGTYTFFPSIAVDQCGNIGIGFSASASTIYAGAYYTLRYASDTAGTVQPTGTLISGLASYVQTDSSGRNRWGDYTGTALDPDNDSSFWVFNEYPFQTNFWSTRYGSFPSGLDYGDLPSSYNNTVFGDDGARHCLGSIYLGSGMDQPPDPKMDGQEHATAAADANDDGVTRDMSDLWLNGASVDLNFDLTDVSGFVDIGLWIDWNGNGTFEPGTDYFEFTSIPGGSVYTDSITVPVSTSVYTVGNPVFARVRVFASGGAPGGTLDSGDYVGLSTNGEVEDYQWLFETTAVTITNIGTQDEITTYFWIILISAIALATAGLILRKRKAN